MDGCRLKALESMSMETHLIDIEVFLWNTIDRTIIQTQSIRKLHSQ